MPATSSSSRLTIGLVSGKGGTGKTSLAVVLGTLLSQAGAKTTVVDADAATEGLTHYFGPQPLLPMDGSAATRGTAFLADGLEGSLWLPEAKANRGTNGTQEDLRDTIRTTSRFGHVTIVDYQAGLSPLLESTIDLCDVLVVVTEADPVSVAAVDRLVRDELKGFHGRLVGVVNRVMPGEEPYYEALSDLLVGVQWIGLLPFDSVVRRAFFRRDLREITTSAFESPYLLALAGVLKKLDFDGLSESIAESTGKAEVDSLQAYQELLAVRREVAERLYRGERNQILGWVTAFVAIVIVALATLGAGTDAITRSSSQLATAAGVLLAVTGAAASILSRSRSRIVDAGSLELLRQVDNRLSEFDVANDALRDSGPKAAR